VQTSRNQGNIVGHLAGNLTALPNANTGFVINEALFYTYSVFFFVDTGLIVSWGDSFDIQ
jgi:hypothetical protein